MEETLKISGKVHIEVFDSNGIKKTELRTPNTVTAAGKQHIANRFGNATEDPMSNMAVGTGTPGTTALGTEVNRQPFQSQSSSGTAWTYVAEWDIEDEFSATITEAGVFNADSGLGGTMLCSASFTPIVKGVNDSLRITWTITIA